MNLLAKQIWKRWHTRDALGHSAAVSFYAIFALAPLLLFGVSVTSHRGGEAEAKHSAVRWLSDMIPEQSAESLLSIVQLDSLEHRSTLETALAGLLFLWAGSLIFTRLVYGTRMLMEEDASEKRISFRGSIARRILGLCLALVAGFVVCAVMAFSSLTTSASRGEGLDLFSLIGLLNTALLTLGSALLLRFAPSHPPRLRDIALVGSAVFVVIFAARVGFQSSLASGTLASAYGVASALFITLTWIFFLSGLHFLAAIVCRELKQEGP